MSTSVATPSRIETRLDARRTHLTTGPAPQARENLLHPVALITLLTAVSLGVHGYHPYAEDGGLYAAGIKRLLNPGLYSYNSAFVDAHLRYSIFAPVIAEVCRFTHLTLPVVLLFIYCTSIWSTLLAVWLLARRCYVSPLAHQGAVLLAAAWLTIPVAGTSLILMDPYVTARSISLPCSLFALSACVDFTSFENRDVAIRSLFSCAGMLLLAALTHPLMAAYAVGNVLLLLLHRIQWSVTRLCSILLLCFSAVALAGTLQLMAPQETAAYALVASTRNYWFLSQWHWYELLGLAAPLLILAVGIITPRRNSPVVEARNALFVTVIASGSTAIIVALLFAHESSSSHLVARLQPLRTFQIVYVVMILTLGATLGEHLLRRNIWRWIGTFALLGGIMLFVQRSTYPSSAHIEWPNTAPTNEWQQAFAWISQNTPSDALFALDADYISMSGEDAQGFRVIAERDALPDYSKDGGEASITPTLTAAWTVGQQTQDRLSAKTDAERLNALQPLNVSWIVLQQHAQTSFSCPYRNSRVKVCRLP